MATEILTLNSTVVAPPWQAIPNVTHHLNLDEWVDDGSSTVLRLMTLDSARYGIDVPASVPYHPGQGQLEVRWVAKKGGAAGTWKTRVGLWIGGVYYWGPTTTLTTGFTVRSTIWASNPETGRLWKRSELGLLQIAFEVVELALILPRAELTAISPLLTLVPDALDRRIASGGRQGDDASASKSGNMSAVAAREGISAIAVGEKVNALADRESDDAEGD